MQLPARVRLLYVLLLLLPDVDVQGEVSTVLHGLSQFFKGCSCPTCKAAVDEYYDHDRDFMNWKLRNARKWPPLSRNWKLRHGTNLGYGSDCCRCPSCKEAGSKYRQGKREEEKALKREGRLTATEYQRALNARLSKES